MRSSRFRGHRTVCHRTVLGPPTGKHNLDSSKLEGFCAITGHANSTILVNGESILPSSIRALIAPLRFLGNSGRDDWISTQGPLNITVPNGTALECRDLHASTNEHSGVFDVTEGLTLQVERGGNVSFSSCSGSKGGAFKASSVRLENAGDVHFKHFHQHG